MREQEIKEKIEKYLEGQTTVLEEQELKAFFGQEVVSEELRQYQPLFNWTEDWSGLDSRQNEEELFAKVDFRGETKLRRIWPAYLWKVAAGLLLLAVGFWAGQQRQQVEATNPWQEEWLDPSASVRLNAVNQMEASGSAMAKEALLETLYFDPSVNVRVKAAQVLVIFLDSNEQMKVLSDALYAEQDPIVQLTLISLLGEVKDPKVKTILTEVAQKEEFLESVREEAFTTATRLDKI